MKVSNGRRNGDSLVLDVWEILDIFVTELVLSTSPNLIYLEIMSILHAGWCMSLLFALLGHRNKAKKLHL